MALAVSSDTLQLDTIAVPALYAIPNKPGRPVVAVFAPGTDEVITQREAARLALAR